MGFVDLMAHLKLLVNKYIELMDKNFDLKKIIIIDNIKNINGSDINNLEEIIKKFYSSDNKNSLILYGKGNYFNKNVRKNLFNNNEKKNY